jgi:hypothetical protein
LEYVLLDLFVGKKLTRTIFWPDGVSLSKAQLKGNFSF